MPLRKISENITIYLYKFNNNNKIMSYEYFKANKFKKKSNYYASCFISFSKF